MMSNSGRSRMLADNLSLNTIPLRGMIRLSLKKGQTLFREDDPANSLFEIVSGSVKIYKLLPDGREQIVDVATEGWVCGFSAGRRYDASCEALVPTCAIAYSREALEKGLGDTRIRIEAQVERQICALHGHVMSLGQGSARERVITFLARFLPGRSIKHCSSAGAARKNATIHFPLSRGEIGQYLGLSSETISRILTDLRSEGIISKGERTRDITVRDPCELCRLSALGCDFVG